MAELFPHMVGWIQVQLSLHPVAERPFSTDTIQAQTKVCPGFFYQDRPRCIAKIFSEPFRGLLAADLPGQVSRGEIIYLTGPVSPTHTSTCSSVRGLGTGLFLAWADPDHGR